MRSEITNAAIKKLSLKVGVEMLSAQSYDVVRFGAIELLKKILKDVKITADAVGVKTVELGVVSNVVKATPRDNFFIPHASFKRLVKSMLPMRFTREAVDFLQSYVEFWMGNLLANAYNVTLTSKRKVVLPKDVALVMNVADTQCM